MANKLTGLTTTEEPMSDKPSNLTATGPSGPTDPAAEARAAAPQPMPAGTARVAAVRTPRDAVIREVSTWEGVSVADHRFGGVEFRLGRRELGHLHATIADLPFPRRRRDELIAAGRARPHHVLPDSGWVTVPMRTAVDAANVIALFRENYERATAHAR